MYKVIAIAVSKKGHGIVFTSDKVKVSTSKIGRLKTFYAYAEVAERGAELATLVASLKVSDFEIDADEELVEL